VWLLESERGNLERHRDNNHGVWFHQTALAIALHVGDAHSAKMLANDLPWFLVDRQIEQGMQQATFPILEVRNIYAARSLFRVPAMLCEWQRMV
jgi:hypothetical protein